MEKKQLALFEAFKFKIAFLQSLILAISFSYFSTAQSLSEKIQKSTQPNQSVIASAGGLAKFNVIELEWTLGESFIGEATNNSSRIYTIGFHQPNIKIKPDLLLAESNSDQINIYPNPVGNKLNVKFQLENAENAGNFKFQLTDLMGKLVLEKEISSQKESPNIDIPEIATGNYQVKIMSANGKILRSFKITKTN